MTSRITNVFVHRREVTLLRPFVTAVRTAYSVDALLVEVRDSDGRSGWGEAPTSWRVTGESHESVRATVLGPLTAAISGRTTDDPGSLSLALTAAVVGNASARAAVESACYDLAARNVDVPLFAYLGGNHTTVRTDMTLSAASTPAEVDSMLVLAAQHVRNGFRTLKVKTGAGADDIESLARIRDVVGSEVTLRVDANQGWSVDAAIRTISAWEDRGIQVELVEQPVHRDNIDGLRAVTRAVSTLILADESVWTRRQLREVLACGAADMVNIKLAKTGGIREALATAALAREHGMPAVVGCMSESHVGIAAAAAVASAIAPASAHDLDAGLWLQSTPATGGVQYDGEQVLLDAAPGSGIRGLQAP